MAKSCGATQPGADRFSYPSYASFRYQAQSWTMPRRVVAKVEWHPGELYPRVGFIVTNLSRLAGGFHPQVVQGVPFGSAWYQLVLRADYRRVAAASRGELISALREAGIPVTEAAPRGPLHLRAPFWGSPQQLARAIRPEAAHASWRPGACPRAERRCDHEDMLIESESRWETVSRARLDQIVSALGQLVH